MFFETNETCKLTCIDIDNLETIIFGQTILGCTSREIEELMIKNNIFNETKENEDWGEMRISFEDYSIDFYFIDDKLVSVTLENKIIPIFPAFFFPNVEYFMNLKKFDTISIETYENFSKTDLP